jgi:hypothetical protein
MKQKLREGNHFRWPAKLARNGALDIFAGHQREDIPMKAPIQKRELTPSELTDVSRPPTTTDPELSLEELSNVSGSCCAGAHYKTVTIAMRKSGGSQD